MLRFLFKLGLVVSAAVLACVAQSETPPPPTGVPEAPILKAGTGKKSVMVIPVREAIDEPVLYILRRGLKEAVERKVDTVVLDMDTPGGRLDVMLEMMEALDRFPGVTVTFVNDEAGSAGALIAATTDEIFFEPKAVMGASEPVMGSGQDLSEGMKRKIMSYLNAKVETYTGSDPRRADVIRAMMDPKFELKIGDVLIKPKDEILTLNVKKALAVYGDPATPLMDVKVVSDMNELLAKKFGTDGFSAKTLEITWSERLASFLNQDSVKSILMGLGLLAVFIEFKTPGFGVFGILGGVLLGIVFLSSYVAGLSGHEPMLLFAVGVVLLALELFLFPGVVFVALTGVVLMLGSLVWAMADLWPNEPVSIAWSADAFVQPIMSLGFGLVIAVALGAALLRFMPRGWFWDRLIIGAAIDGTAQVSGSSVEAAGRVLALVGRSGVAATDLRPGGQVEIDGQRFEARVDVGSVRAGARIVVSGRTDFGLIVEEERA
jgi:membrane-bound serine protease (ClpP class)